MVNNQQLVDRLYGDYRQNHEFLMQNQQISFANDYKSQFSKVILLSSASFFEVEILETIKKQLNPGLCELTYEFIKNKALARQYHTLFDWDKRNANKFFSLFGDNFKQFMSNKVSLEEGLASAISDFITIGSLRNQLAHQNYAAFVLNLTAEEIFEKHSNAYNNFILKIPGYMNEFKEMSQDVTV